MEDKIHWSTQYFHGFPNQVIQIFFTGGIGWYYLCVEFFRQFLYLAHSESYRSVGQCHRRTFPDCFFRNLPCHGLIVQRTKNDPFLTFQKIVSHVSLDRKSTRLNSSHVKSSYAVFCLQKKTRR